jgi:hypothetical protein
MSLKILMNCSLASKGGALQVTQSILTEASKDPRIEYRVVGTRQLSQALEKAGIKLSHYHLIKENSGWKRYFEANRVLAELEKEFKPDVCYSVYGPTTWKPKTRPHFVGFAYGQLIYPELESYSQTPFFRKILSQTVNYFRKQYVKNGDYWFVQTGVVADRLAETFSLKRENIFVVSNTYSSAFQVRLENQSSPRPEDQYFRILVPSAYYHHKNLVLIPKVIKELDKISLPKKPKFQFTIPVDHPGWSTLMNLANRLGVSNDSMETLGAIPNAFFADAYHQADMVFLPTLIECSTATYPEAFASKRPLSTTNRDFAKELCRDAALYFDPYSPEEAANTIVRIITDRDCRDLLVKNGTLQLQSGYCTPAERWQTIYSKLSTLK